MTSMHVTTIKDVYVISSVLEQMTALKPKVQTILPLLLRLLLLMTVTVKIMIMMMIHLRTQSLGRHGRLLKTSAQTLTTVRTVTHAQST